ncbi:hypothetical protein GALL_107640 [mine drainage metagenome]|uniref:Uncharacterized protein n=1 Tax=mine drainage metagenome TaxID=410659 RepID=A0A1J5SFI4_9ZZZZ
MFGFISSAALRVQALELADAFDRDCQPPQRAAAKAASEKTAVRALEKLCAATAAYARERKLGLLGRARLARALQSELRRRGYPQDLVGKLTSAVTVNALVSPGRKDSGA